MNDYSNRTPRTFKTGATYVSSKVLWDGSEETIFLVLKPCEAWNKWYNPHPVQYLALNLFTGETFKFHRDSHIADDAKELNI